jgi:TPR repeat protein
MNGRGQYRFWGLRPVRRWRLACALPLVLLLAVWAPKAEAALDVDSRAALIVGNAGYGFSPLANPLNDARALAGSLRELGFEVTLLENAGLAELQAALERMAQTFGEGGIGLFYYAGHALQHQGVNYLLPTDFALDQGSDLPAHSISIDTVLDALERSGVGLKLVILDACRDYPFGNINEAFGQGLASVAATGETLVAYATAAGQVALDGTGPNSPYTSALISALELPGHDIYDVFRTVRAKVREATNGRQLPWVSGSIETQVVLREPQPEPEVPAQVTVAGVHWNTIQASADPADFNQFLQLYPESKYREDALARFQLLSSRGEESPGPILAAAPALVGPGNRMLEVTSCDLFAADPYDPERVATGIPWGLVNTRQAIRACAAEVAENPDNARLNYQMGRALDIAERFEEALSFYQRAIDGGYAKAAFNVGFMYRTARGLARNFEKAAEYYYLAALQGVPVAREALAKLFEEGWGVPQSYQQSFYWRQLAAADSFAPSIDGLAKMYAEGWGTDADLGEAVRYHRMAAALGWGNALSNMGKLYANGEGVAQDIGEAVRWFAEATEQGHAYAPYHWAGLLRDGKGVPKDPQRALALFQLSAERGFEWALWAIAEMYHKGALGQSDIETAYYYYWIARAAGEMRRNSGSDELAVLANERLEEVRSQLGDDLARSIERRAETWIAQNGLLQFTLTSVY